LSLRVSRYPGLQEVEKDAPSPHGVFFCDQEEFFLEVIVAITWGSSHFLFTQTCPLAEADPLQKTPNFFLEPRFFREPFLTLGSFFPLFAHAVPLLRSRIQLNLFPALSLTENVRRGPTRATYLYPCRWIPLTRALLSYSYGVFPNPPLWLTLPADVKPFVPEVALLLYWTRAPRAVRFRPRLPRPFLRLVGTRFERQRGNEGPSGNILFNSIFR